MARREWTWTSKQFDKLNKVGEVLQTLAKYKPLTLRQIFYQLVGQGYIENNVSQYGMLSKLLKYARIDGYVSWDDIEDRVRAFHDLRGWDDKEHFSRQEVRHFLNGYKRDLMQSQDRYIEVWLEKDALSAIFRRVTEPYTIPVTVCRGFSSVSFLNDFRKRLLDYANKKAVMLYFGDFDPSGVEMLESMKTTLTGELEIHGIEFKRVALNGEDIFSYNLPHDPDALKESDTRAKKFKERYGTYAVELDALRPDVLEGKIRDAIESELDIEAFNFEIQQQNREVDLLKSLRDRVISFMGEQV